MATNSENLEKLQSALRGVGTNLSQALEVLKELAKSGADAGLKKLERGLSGLEGEVKEALQALEKIELKESTDSVLECKIYSFKEALAWIKEHLDPKRHGAASITKEMEGDKIVLKLCFLDHDRKPLLKEGDWFLKVKTDEICQDLKNNFGDKDMIIVQ